MGADIKQSWWTLHCFGTTPIPFSNNAFLINWFWSRISTGYGKLTYHLQKIDEPLLKHFWCIKFQCNWPTTITNTKNTIVVVTKCKWCSCIQKWCSVKCHWGVASLHLVFQRIENVRIFLFSNPEVPKVLFDWSINGLESISLYNGIHLWRW